MTLWNWVYHWEKQKIDWKFQQKFKASLILLGNTMTPHFTDYHVEKFLMCCFPLLLVDWSYIKEIPIH